MRQVADFEFSEEIAGAVQNFLDGKTHNPLAMLGERHYRQVHLPMLEQILSDNEPAPTNFREWFRLPEIVFFLSVTMPCWLEFQRTPWTLFRRVCRGGSLEAFAELEQLVRIDPEVVNDSRIRPVVFEMWKRNPEGYKLIQRAAREGCKSAVSQVDVKFLLGGLLMRWSKELQSVVENLHFELMAKHALPGREAEVQPWIKRLHSILHDRAYVGELRYKGSWLRGVHEPIVELSVCDSVQTRLGEKVYHPRESVFGANMIRCGHCSRPDAVEIKHKPTSHGPRAYQYYRCPRYN